MLSFYFSLSLSVMSLFTEISSLKMCSLTSADVLVLRTWALQWCFPQIRCVCVCVCVCGYVTIERMSEHTNQSYARHSSPLGDPQYFEPDYCSSGVLTTEVDMYSAGLTLLAVLFLIDPRQAPALREDFLENPAREVVKIMARHEWAGWMENTVHSLLDLGIR